MPVARKIVDVEIWVGETPTDGARRGLYTDLNNGKVVMVHFHHNSEDCHDRCGILTKDEADEVVKP